MSGLPHWVYGKRPVAEALSAPGGKPIELLVAVGRGHASPELLKAARRRGARVRFVPRRELDRIAEGGVHQGLALRLALEGDSGDWRRFLDALSAAEKARALLVALDQIQDPHNLGAIARSAACLGAKALLVPERRSASLSPAAVKASAGALARFPVLEAGNLAQCLRQLKERGFWIYGADASGKPAWTITFNRPLVLVIGSEGAGMRPLVRSLCDELAAIPQAQGGVASLNASCAAAALLYEASRPRA